MNDFKLALHNYLEKFKFIFYVMLHPFKGFWDLKHEKKGSKAVAITLSLLYVLSGIIYDQFAAYSFNPMAANPENINMFESLLSTVIVLLLWCYSNWGLTTLFDGEGSVKDVFLYTTVALVPLILYNLIMAPLTNILSIDEANIISTLQTFSYLWAGILLYTGTMTTHQYGTIRTLIIIIFIILGMLLIMFMSIMFFFLLQTLFNVGYVIYRELTLRY